MLTAILPTEIVQTCTEQGTGTFKIHKDKKIFAASFSLRFLRRGNSFAIAKELLHYKISLT